MNGKNNSRTSAAEKGAGANALYTAKKPYFKKMCFLSLYLTKIIGSQGLQWLPQT